MLIDDVQITIQAGPGGDGIVHFFSDLHRPKGGPDGGNGGKGGDVYFKSISDIGSLRQFRHEKDFVAPAGDPGGSNQRTGKGGNDLYINVPFGSIITYDNGTQIELDKVGLIVMAGKGGRGGKGNYHYRSSTNQTPQERQLGQKPLVKTVHIQLKLIADIGLIGLPNAGKTSLLNELTPANAKVANYSFTTLEPNLGVTKGGNIIADIPGLIEGASEGKGLGYKFLRHIERTKIMVHCLSVESVNPLKDYQTVRQELDNYSSNLTNKKEIIVLTKTDLLNPDQVAKIAKTIHAQLAVSIADDNSIKSLNDLLAKELKTINQINP